MIAVENIRRAIMKATQEEMEIDKIIDGLYLGGLDAEDTERIATELEARKQRIIKFRIYLERQIVVIFRAVWRRRNAFAGRGGTSAVSDKMLLTVPTPPTAEAANCSLWQRGMTCEAAA